MPTYQFRCPDGTIIERVFKISEVPESIPVPDGDGEAVRIISGGAGLIFKGSGFYITDYGKDGKKDQRDAKASEGKESKGSKEGASSGGDAKAAPVASDKPAPAAPSSSSSSTTPGGKE